MKKGIELYVVVGLAVTLLVAMYLVTLALWAVSLQEAPLWYPVGEEAFQVVQNGPTEMIISQATWEGAGLSGMTVWVDDRQVCRAEESSAGIWRLTDRNSAHEDFKCRVNLNVVEVGPFDRPEPPPPDLPGK